MKIDSCGFVDAEGYRFQVLKDFIIRERQRQGFTLKMRCEFAQAIGITGFDHV
jgi:hypothetical protein